MQVRELVRKIRGMTLHARGEVLTIKPSMKIKFCIEVPYAMIVRNFNGYPEVNTMDGVIPIKNSHKVVKPEYTTTS